jgi:hypothetical protein
MASINIIVNRSLLPYLNGLRDGGLKEAQELIDAIEEHSEVKLKEEY